MRRFIYQWQSRAGAGLQARGLWLFWRGKPVYLIGAGTEGVYVSGDAGLSAAEMRALWLRHLDRMAEHHINFLQLNPWRFCGDAGAPGWACPYRRRDVASAVPRVPRYRLNQWHEPFFDALRFVCREARRREIFVSVTCFDDGALAPGGAEGGPWTRHPWNARCGGPCPRPEDFYDLANDDIRAIQEAWARRIFAATQDCPNVLYEVCREMGASAGCAGRAEPPDTVRDWLRHHLAFARAHACGHLRAISGSSWSENGGSAEALWREEGVDVVLPHERDGAAALRREQTAHHFRFYTSEGIHKPRVLADVAFDGLSVAHAFEEERRHFWTALCSGGHAVCGAGSSFAVTPTWESLRALGAFLRGSGIRWWEMEPIGDLLPSREARVYGIGNAAAGEYLIYFLEQPEETIPLTLPSSAPGTTYAWLDPVSLSVIEEGAFDTTIPLAPPTFPAAVGDMALWVRPAASRSERV